MMKNAVNKILRHSGYQMQRVRRPEPVVDAPGPTVPLDRRIAEDVVAFFRHVDPLY